jgi:hypothetical protein
MKLKVLIGCEMSGTIRDEFLALGHEALSADLQPSLKPGPHYQGDVFDVIDYPWDLGIFHFPCTHSSVSGAKHFAAKKLDGRYYAGNSLWLRGWKAAQHIPAVCFEHPVSVISTLFRKPDQVVDPFMFGDPFKKSTALWLRGLPLLKRTSDLTTGDQACWKMGPSPERANLRSATYPGLAKAIATQFSAHLSAKTQLELT